MKKFKALVGIVVAASLICSSVMAADDEEGFKPLGNGKDMSNFDIVGAPASIWTVEGDVIKCKGKPNGYFVTKTSYKNFVLRFDFRYPEKAGNSGYLIYCTGKPKVWPKCIEVQGQYAGVGSIFPIGGATGARPKVDDAVRKKVRKPHTEWNSLEIVSKDGALTAKLNGKVISQSEPYDLTEGTIGFQSEGAPIDFRNIRIKVTE